MSEAKEEKALHTTKAMRDAPRGAIYVWPNTTTYYPQKLARHLKRTDLNIVSPAIFDGGGYRLRGLYVPVILDHATILTDEQQRVLEEWRALSGER